MGKIVKTLLLLSGLAASLPIHAQYDRRGYMRTDDSDTFLYEYTTHGPESIANSTADFSLRVAWYGAEVKLYRNDALTHGFIDLIVWEYQDEVIENPFTMTFTLTNEQATELYNTYKQLSVSSMPSGNHIKDWREVPDGPYCCIESKSNGLYSVKGYHDPKLFSNLPEGKIINEFLDAMNKICNYEELYTKFKRHIPFNNWSMDDGYYYTIIKPGDDATD